MYHSSVEPNERLMSLAHVYSIDEVMRVSDMFARSGYFKDARTASQVFAKIVAGQELGVGPMTAMSMIHIIDGKATMDATLVGAQIKKSGRYDYRVKQSDEQLCVLEFTERGKTVGESSFSMDDARRAGLAARSIWKSYPRDMLRARALTRGARMYCPDVFNGAIYTPEEIGARVDVDDTGALLVLDDAPAVGNRRVSSDDSALIRSIYTRLGLQAKTGDPTAHTEAMQAVSEALDLTPPIARWSELTVAQLEAYLALPTPNSESVAA